MVKEWSANYGHTHIAQHWRSKGYEAIELSYLIECNVKNIFPQTSCKKGDRESSYKLLFVF